MANVQFTEVLTIGCFGIGHFHPNVQLARASAMTIRSAGKKPRITMIVPITYDNLVRVMKSEEIEQVEVDNWFRRTIDDGDIEQCFYTVAAMPAGKELLQIQIQIQSSWIPFIENLYETRDSKPEIILSDMMIFIDLELAKKWPCEKYTMFPSPITCHYMIPQMTVLVQGKDDEQLASEPSTESSIGDVSGTGSSKLTFPGIAGIDLDAEVETIQVFNDESDREAGYAAMKAFIKLHLETNEARNGIICNDVAGFYPPAFLENCKMHPDYEVLLVGPLAMNFENRTGLDDTVPDECLNWLGSKKADSVILISMGSQFDLPSSIISVLTKAFTELLTKSDDIHILWAHRPLKETNTITEYTPDELGLPEGWVDRHSGRVMVSSWVNQPRCLQHPAIGLFMTHAGWNGLAEAIGVGHSPLLLCPVSAEQPANAKFMEAYYHVGERLWRNIKESSDLKESHVIDKIMNCLHNEQYTSELAKMRATARAAWEKEDGSSKLNFRAAFRSILEN